MQSASDRTLKKLACLLAVGIVSVLVALQLLAKKPAQTSRHAEPDENRTQSTYGEIPNGPRYAVQKEASFVFCKLSAVQELLDAQKRLTGETEEKTNQFLHSLCVRQEAQGIRSELTRDYIVRLINEDPKLGGFCEIYLENCKEPIGPHLWIHRSCLLDQKSLFGSRIFTGYLVFRGTEGTLVENADILKLQDLIASIYEGEISDDAASKCVFTPDAQGGEVETLLDDFVIYRDHHPTEERLIRFAMPRQGNDDPLFSGAVRFTRRGEFTTKTGTVRLLPIMELQKGIQ